jgi:sugar/nucleoside kinase (ribokinase family)
MRAAVVSRGADGVVFHGRGGSLAYPAHRVSAVDTTGAADAFAAGFLYKVVAGASEGHAVGAGIAWAAATVQSPASIPPPWQVVRDSVRDPYPTRLEG